MTQNKFHIVGNLLGLVIICMILTFAFIDQIMTHDLPCPLCLLQRTAFVGIGLCLCMNLKDGIKVNHYGFIILTALLGFAVAFRQVFLHIAPGDPGYGPLVFGLHLYNWSAIAFLVVIGLVATGMFMEKGFMPYSKPITKPTTVLMLLFLGLVLANGISTMLECGILVCPDNPVKYEWLSLNAFSYKQ